MLPVSAKLLIAGATIYTVQAPAQRAIIKMVRVVNNAASARTFNVYVNTGNGSIRFSGKDQNLEAGYIALDVYEFELAHGHSIFASCSADNDVDIFISGHELDSTGRLLP